MACGEQRTATRTKEWFGAAVQRASKVSSEDAVAWRLTRERDMENWGDRVGVGTMVAT